MLNIAHLFMTRQLDYPIIAWYSIVYHLKVLLAYLNHPPFRQYFWYFLFVLLFCLISWVYLLHFFSLLLCFVQKLSCSTSWNILLVISTFLVYTYTQRGVCIHRKYKWLVRYSMVFHGTLYIESIFVNFTCTIILFHFLSVYLIFAFFSLLLSIAVLMFIFCLQAILIC